MLNIRPHYDLKSVNDFLNSTGDFLSDGIGRAFSSVGDFIDSASKKVGDWVNNATGVTGQQDFQRDMRDTSITSSADQYEKLGLNKSLLYGSGASAASTPSGSHGGSLSLPSIDGLINAAANILNANTRQFVADRQNRHLDWEEKDQLDRHSLEIYDSVGRLLNSSVRTIDRTRY